MQLSQLFSLVALSAWGVLGGLASPISTHPLEKRVSNSKWSFYDAGLGACGTVNSNSDFIVALNAEDFGGGYPGPHCGKTITLRYGGKTAEAKIMDRCPGCPKGGLDLSRGLFSYFASQDKGIIYGEWDFGSGSAPAPAPTPQPLTSSTPAAAPAPSSTPQPPSSSIPPQASPSPVNNVDVQPSSSAPAPAPSSSAVPSSSVQASSSAAVSSSVSPVASSDPSSSSASPASSLPAPAPSAPAPSPSPSPAPVQGDDEEEYDDDCEEWEYEDDEEVSPAVPVVSPPAVAPSSAAPVPRVTSPSASPAPAFAPAGAKAPSPPAQESPVVEKPVVNVAPVPGTNDSVEKSIQENMNIIAQLLNKLGDMIKTLMANAQKDA